MFWRIEVVLGRSCAPWVSASRCVHVACWDIHTFMCCGGKSASEAVWAVAVQSRNGQMKEGLLEGFYQNKLKKTHNVLITATHVRWHGWRIPTQSEGFRIHHVFNKYPTTTNWASDITQSWVIRTKTGNIGLSNSVICKFYPFAPTNTVSGLSAENKCHCAYETSIVSQSW